MDNIDKILKYIRRTKPEPATRQKNTANRGYNMPLSPR